VNGTAIESAESACAPPRRARPYPVPTLRPQQAAAALTTTLDARSDELRIETSRRFCMLLSTRYAPGSKQHHHGRRHLGPQTGHEPRFGRRSHLRMESARSRRRGGGRPLLKALKPEDPQVVVRQRRRRRHALLIANACFTYQSTSLPRCTLPLALARA